ncbi:hypothetical protein KFK09_019016 [Dendrobium nobile]|uniref:Uncharacterized protein n=1 Tax=Dendrobium nobile TaxID=94219 RepID=A0A8T3AWW2_DENNO|nr:hypothetical protein KFK09_019016 [Dendrobium nobile]
MAVLTYEDQFLVTFSFGFDGIVSWKSSLQRVVALSSTEVEFAIATKGSWSWKPGLTVADSRVIKR